MHGNPAETPPSREGGRDAAASVPARDAASGQGPGGSEPYGPLALSRLAKPDGRALILYEVRSPPEGAR